VSGTGKERKRCVAQMSAPIACACCDEACESPRSTPPKRPFASPSKTSTSAPHGSSLRGRPLWNAVAMLILVLLHIALWCAVCRAYHLTADENGFMETTQALLLALTSLLYLSAAVVSTSPERLLFSGLTLLGVSCLLREVDVRGFNLNPVVTSMVNGLGRNLILGLMWLGLLLACALNVRRLSTIFLAWVKSPAGHAILLAGLFLFLGRPFDRNAFVIPKSAAQFCEELCESNGYLLLFLSSILSLRSSVRTRRALHCIRETDHGRGMEGENLGLADET